MKNQVALTQADKDKLRKLNANSKRAVGIFLGITAGAVVAVLGGLYFSGSVWPQIAMLFVGMLAIGCFMSWRETQKIDRDIESGMKENVSGVVSKKTISRGNQTFSYDADTLARAALRVEEQELNKPITRYGILDNEIDSASAHWYGVEIDGINYNIGVRGWISVKEGDTLNLEVAPRSKRVLSSEKIPSASTMD
jgi:hypothetical protein